MSALSSLSSQTASLQANKAYKNEAYENKETNKKKPAKLIRWAGHDHGKTGSSIRATHLRTSAKCRGHGLQHKDLLRSTPS
jgi:hypothetical protein